MSTQEPAGPSARDRARNLMKVALAPDWSMAGALHSVKPHEIAEALEVAESSMIPLCRRFTPAALKESEEGKALDIALRPIGAKLAPSMSPAQASAWRDAVMMSLMKWPARVAVAAAKQGVMERYEFGLNGVDARLHEIAEQIDERHRLALHRLKLMRAEIERAASRQPAIEHKPHVWTQEDIDEANRCFRQVGSRVRYRLGPDGTCETNAEDIDAEENMAYKEPSETRNEEG